jgi:hypothetical protein
MSSSINPCVPIDCSPEAQEDRRKWLKDLYGKLYTGVQSISDRSRSVSYHSGNDLWKLINALQGEIALCAGCLNRRATARRIFHVAYNKWM